jgi:hypothetical protein
MRWTYRRSAARQPARHRRRRPFKRDHDLPWDLCNSARSSRSRTGTIRRGEDQWTRTRLRRASALESAELNRELLAQLKCEADAVCVALAAELEIEDGLGQLARLLGVRLIPEYGAI